MPAILDDAIARRAELLDEIEEYDTNEPIGFP